MNLIVKILGKAARLPATGSSMLPVGVEAQALNRGGKTKTAHEYHGKRWADYYSRNIQIVEAQLAQKLYGLFNQGPALENLQQLAEGCVREMVFGKDATFNTAITEEGKLRVYAKIGKSKLDMVKFFKSRKKELDASDVADIIRLFGGWVELGGTLEYLEGRGQDSWGSANKNPNFTKTYEMKDAYRPGVPGHKGKWQKSEVEEYWGDQKAEERFENVPVARRKRGEGRLIEEHIKPLMRDPAAFSGMGGCPAIRGWASAPQGIATSLNWTAFWA